MKSFEPRLALQQGAALQELTRMITTPARTPEETRKIMVVYQTKVKDAEDHNRPLGSEYLKSVLIGITDPTTRIHTIACQSNEVTAETFENAIMEFVTGAMPPATTTTTATPMQIGSMGAVPGATGEGPGGYGEHRGADAWMDEKWSESGYYPYQSYSNDDGDGEHQQNEQQENLWALKGGKKGSGKGGKGSRVCHGCGSPDHFIANCPVNGKGCGKGPKGFQPYPPNYNYKGNYATKGQYPKGGKGGGKAGPKDGCYVCGGAHYAANCPRNHAPQK